MTSPFIPSSFTYGDAPSGGSVMPMVIAGRNPSNTIDISYPAGYFWLSSLDIRNSNNTTGSGNLYYQAGNSSGSPNWKLVTAVLGTGVIVFGDLATEILIGGLVTDDISIGDSMTTGDISIGESQTSGTLTLGSIAAGTGLIRIADGTGSQTINLGTQGSKIIKIGSTNSASSLIFQAGMGGIGFSSGQYVKVSPATNLTNPNVLTGANYFIACNTSAAVIVTLPAVPTIGQVYVIADATGTANVNNITISGNGKNINGAANLVITTNYQVTTLWYNGTRWNYQQ